MSDNQSSSSKYFIPVALIVLSLITSVLFSQVFPLGSGSDKESLATSEEAATSPDPVAETADQQDSTADTGSQAGGSDDPQISDKADSAGDPVVQIESEPASKVTADQEPSDIPAIADLAVLVPVSNTLCEGQSPWREGDRRLSDVTQAPGCYGLRFELAKSATVLLISLRDGAAPRSLMAEGCRPFGFSSARFEPGKAQQLPRGVDGQPGVFQTSATPATTRFVLVAAAQPTESMSILESGVGNLCGQSATLTDAQVQTQLDTLEQTEGVFVKTVQGQL